MKKNKDWGKKCNTVVDLIMRRPKNRRDVTRVTQLTTVIRLSLHYSLLLERINNNSSWRTMTQIRICDA